MARRGKRARLRAQAKYGILLHRVLLIVQAQRCGEITAEIVSPRCRRHHRAAAR